MTNTNELTKQILNVLLLSGFNVWRQNNIAVKGRRFTGKKGVPDIIGFEKSTGRFIGVEVKSEKDRLSKEQKELHQEMKEAGAIIFVARDFNQFMFELKGWCEGCNKTICKEPCEEGNNFNLPM